MVRTAPGVQLRTTADYLGAYLAELREAGISSDLAERITYDLAVSIHRDGGGVCIGKLREVV